jgi:hypothetical protein
LLTHACNKWGRGKDGTADVDRRKRRRRRDDPIIDIAGEQRRDNSTVDVAGGRRGDYLNAIVGPLLVAGRTALPTPPASSGGAFFAVPPAALFRKRMPRRTTRTTAHARRMHLTSGGAGRTHAGTVDVNRRRRQRRRDNPIVDIAGERQRDNSTAPVGPLSGAERTVLTLLPAGGGGAFFVVPPAATVP